MNGLLDSWIHVVVSDGYEHITTLFLSALSNYVIFQENHIVTGY